MSRDKISIQLPETASAHKQITVRSNSFEHNAPIPDRYTAYYDNISPSLSWSGLPPETVSTVLVVEDPDAPTNEPVTHWLFMNLPPEGTDLPEDLPREVMLEGKYNKAQQGTNDLFGVGYVGPKPPPGHGVHHYHFQVFALDTKIDLIADFSRTELLDAMDGHVLAKGEIVGTYERRADEQ